MPWRRSPRKELRRGDKVVAVRPIGAIPEGTGGVIKVVDGFKWTRYWVAWDTGEWMGSVDAGSVVAANRLAEWKQEQESLAASRSAAPVAVAGSDGGGAAGGGAAGGGSAGGVPEHLLERSRQARARKAEQSA